LKIFPSHCGVGSQFLLWAQSVACRFLRHHFVFAQDPSDNLMLLQPLFHFKATKGQLRCHCHSLAPLYTSVRSLRKSCFRAISTFASLVAKVFLRIGTSIAPFSFDEIKVQLRCYTRFTASWCNVRVFSLFWGFGRESSGEVAWSWECFEPWT